MIIHCSYVSSLQSSNLFMLVGFMYPLLGNRIWPDKWGVHAVVHLNLSVAMEIIMLKKALFTVVGYLSHVPIYCHRKETNWTQIKDAVVV